MGGCIAAEGVVALKRVEGRGVSDGSSAEVNTERSSARADFGRQSSLVPESGPTSSNLLHVRNRYITRYSTLRYMYL